MKIYRRYGRTFRDIGQSRSRRLAERPRARPSHARRHARLHREHPRAPGVAADPGRCARAFSRGCPGRADAILAPCTTSSCATFFPTPPAIRIPASWAGCMAAARAGHAGRDAGRRAERQSRRPRSHADRSRAADRPVGARAVRISRDGERPVRHRHVDGQPDRRADRAHRARSASRCAATASPSSGKRLVAYTSARAHGCIAQAMDLSGLGSDGAARHSNRRSPSDRHRRARGGDRAGPRRRPDAVPGRRHRRHGRYRRHRRSRGARRHRAPRDSSGSTSTARSARSPSWRRTSRRGSPASSRRIRSRSISTNGGRCPTTPASSWCATATLHRDTFASPAAYLRRETRGLAAGSPWPCDFGPDLSRGFRALKTWFTLKVYGTDALGAMIARTCALARYLEIKIAADAANSNCWRRSRSTSSASAIAAPIRTGSTPRSSPICTSPASPRRPRRSIGGRLAIRAAIVNHRTEPRDIDAMLKAVLNFGAAVTAKSRAA